MSYILEALKKSEQERRQGQVPDISSLHGDILTPPGKKTPIKILAAVCVVAIIAVIVFLLNRDQGAIEIPAPPHPPAPKAVAVITIAPPGLKEDTAKTDNNAPVPIAAIPTAAPAHAPGNKKTTGVTHLADLPAKPSNRLPQLKISAHFYSDTPAARMASVNGRILHQGDEVEPGITVHEITPEGVIFDHNGNLILVPVY